MEKKSFKNGTKKSHNGTKNNSKKKRRKSSKTHTQKNCAQNMLTQKCDKIVSEKREKSSRIFKLNKRKKLAAKATKKLIE